MNNNGSIISKRQKDILVYLCMFIYFTSYVTRINYGAVVSEIVSATGMTKDLVSLPVTGLFITYGVGQLISGILGDRIAPKYLMTGGLVLASTMNILLPLNNHPTYMLVVWCINGFGQALMWPPIVKLLSTYLTETEYAVSVLKLSWGSSFGTIAVYLASPLLISFIGWKSVFAVAAVFGVIGAALCMTGITSVERQVKKAGGVLPVSQSPIKKSPKKAISQKASSLTPGYLILIPCFAAIILQGSLRDGVTTWMPSYIDETFHLGSAISILSGVILPIFSILCMNFTRTIYVRFLQNELLLSGIIFAVSAAGSGILAAFFGASPILSIACSALIVACMHAVNLLLICMLPGHYRAGGKISTVSGVLNFATYVGAALSTYAFAALSEIAGWQGTILLWLAVSGCGALICIVSAKFWKTKR